jgi:hypothetical protein
MDLENVALEIEKDAAKLLQKRLDRLRKRKFVLFPFMRLMMLARKLARISRKLFGE